MFSVRNGGIALFAVLTVGNLAWAQPRSEPEGARGFLGVMVAPAPNGAAGIVLMEVTPNSPAAKAGLRPGDRVVKLANEEVRNVETFMQTMAAKKPGEKLALGIVRNGKDETINVALGERPASAPFAFPEPPGLRRPAFLGVQTRDLTPELRKRLKVEVDAGAVVADVVPNSPAASAGLLRDDVITAVNGSPVKTPFELHDAIQTAGPGKEITLQIVRGTEKRSVSATLREGAFGFFVTPRESRYPSAEVESMLDPGRRINDLERRVAELEKRLHDMEKK